jgi:hypothetical protein
MSRKATMSLALALGLATSALAGCGADASGDDLGIDDTLAPVGPMGKEDSAGKPGLRVATDTSATQVWIARNKWEDTSTPAAQAEGLAWPANSGLTWDEKFSRWVDSLDVVQGTEGYTTFRLTTPWGKTAPAPVLECAETAIFLRATFAAWYNLPFYMEAVDSHGRHIYFGHFGIRTSGGRYAGTPNFAYVYKDYSKYTAQDLATKGWPHDSSLRTKAAVGGEDEQPEIGAGTHFGAYLDEVHLNKRAGYLIIYLLNYFGSMNLADSANTYNLVPEAMHPGDILLHRWQRDGIGDTKNIKTVGHNGSGAMTARLMSGSMPRRQPKLYDEITSKSYFTEDDTGGPGENWEGDAYFKLGGGLKRWRVTKNIGGYWTNTWMAADEASWINDQDEARITARPATFQTLLGEVSPQEKLAALQQQIRDSRDHLMKYPASCAARQRRERAFHELYELAPRLGKSKLQLDTQYRDLSDYVFAELSYGESKTCCWNSSTAAMAEIIMGRANEEQDGTCAAPTVFKASGGGYQSWKDWASAHGRGADWRDWSEDEPCAQRNVQDDVEVTHEGLDWCELR